ncbi:acyl-CoA thioesterase [Aestuariirhabdus litorea]|uniref:Acyl-CoA thioesterase n=1 Tax=Aestuariirhabdus litorea TaxID=2528527 RepID=A0A3P3VR71_9GAMM|nr:thioesterase family protein [Aestuariirhabdus litorea]RRJ83323.1 acyl-CoA thioesterase [Aestuariirhabdus litorea]RWW93483.1 acyl-CoA thioesterase [Endozoicomonadaceae bacterium GTF-13]
MKSDRPSHEDFPHFQTLNTRWMDNDLYGHINNVTYYAYFDTVVNRYLIDAGGLDIHSGPVIAYVVSSGCDYFRSAAYPQVLEIGLRVTKLGNSSVTYSLGVFAQGEEALLACGQFVHVFVDRARETPVPIPATLRAALEPLCAPG